MFSATSGCWAPPMQKYLLVTKSNNFYSLYIYFIKVNYVLLYYVFLAIFLCISLLYVHLHFVLKIIKITKSLSESLLCIIGAKSHNKGKTKPKTSLKEPY